MNGKWNEDLKALLVPIEGLVEDSDNANTHGDDNISAIRESLLAFGQQKPIVVALSEATVRESRDSEPTLVVKAGNGTLQAAKALEWTHLAVVRFDGTGEAAVAFALADNRSASLSRLDPVVVGKQTKWLSENWPEWKPESVGYDWSALQKFTEWKVEPVVVAPLSPVLDPAVEFAKAQAAQAALLVQAAAATSKGALVGPEPVRPEAFSVLVECDTEEQLDELVEVLLKGDYRCRRQ